MDKSIIPKQQEKYPSPPDSQKENNTDTPLIIFIALLIVGIIIMGVWKNDEVSSGQTDISPNSITNVSETETTASSGEEGGEQDIHINETHDDTTTDGEYLIVDPGTTYVVRFGGYIYSIMEEKDDYIMYYTSPGETLEIDERLDNYWYKVTYYLAGEGIAHQGYIIIQ